MKLYSRKNHVSIENDCIIKRFSDEHSFRRELDMVMLLKNANVPVPDVLSAKDNIIEYNVIEGKTYQSMVDRFDQKHADALIKWLESYYVAAGALRGDVNLRNFIYCEKTGVCFGIDFEDACGIGEKESDFGRIIAFAATYDPSFTYEKEVCARLLFSSFKNAGANVERIRNAYEMEMRDIINRRAGKSYNMDIAFEFWEKILL